MVFLLEDYLTLIKDESGVIKASPVQAQDGSGKDTCFLAGAIRFPPGKHLISVKVRKDGGQVNLIVADTGIAIPPEDFNKIFDAFHRGKNAVGIERTGLRLNIVKRAVDLRSGRVTVASEPGAGSIFTVSHPVSS